MTTQKIEAVFQNGTFHPVQPIVTHIGEGQRVQLVVEVEDKPNIKDLAASVYAGLTAEEIDEVENIALDRRNFFGRDSE